MTLYIEYVVFNNFAIDYLVLYMTSLCLRRHVAWWRLVIAASLGAGYAVLSPITPFPFDVPLRIIVLALICLIAIGHRLKMYLKFTGVFTMLSFTLGGLVIGVSNLSQSVGQVLEDPNGYYLGLVAIGVIAMLIGIKWCVRLRSVKKVDNVLREYRLKGEGSEKQGKALYDSGNRLYYKGIYPVIVAGEDCELGKKVGNIHVATINGKSNAAVYSVRQIVVGNKTYKDLFAIKCKLGQDYDLILHADLL